MAIISKYSVKLVREECCHFETKKINGAAIAAQIGWESYFRDADREMFVVFFVDTKLNCIGMNCVTVGTLNQSLVSPQNVFKPAILANAYGVIILHNHPSGDPAPSNEDRAVTSKMRRGGELLGIRLLDHVIVGDSASNFYSFADNGALLDM